MKSLYIIVGIVHLLSLVYASAPDAADKTPLEEYTLVPGSVTNTVDPHDDNIKTAPRSPITKEVFELDPNDITPAIDPDIKEHHAPNPEKTEVQTRDRLGRRTCPDSKPWLCDGATCFNFFKYNCCKGGHVCKDPKLCITNASGHIACK